MALIGSSPSTPHYDTKRAAGRLAAKATAFDFKVEFDRETDGRWIADIPAPPGVMVYGRTRKQALAAVEALVLRAIADCLEHREALPVLFAA